MSNFNGRLFGGRLFAGKLFRGPRRSQPFDGADDYSSDARPRAEFDDDDLIDLAITLITAGVLDG